MKSKIILILLIFLPIFSIAQETLKGMVMVKENGEMRGLEGATVYWQDTSIGATTDENGWFEI